MTGRGLLRLALPSKGRLAEPADAAAARRRHQFEPNGRTLHAHCLRPRPRPAARALRRHPRAGRPTGDVDLGIAGQNQIIETGVDVEPLLELGFGRCRLALAVPDGSRDPRRSPTSTAAASRPPTRAPSPRALASAGIDAELVTLGGLGRARARGCTPPTRSSTSSRAARRCARTGCVELRDAARVAGRADRAAATLAGEQARARSRSCGCCSTPCSPRGPKRYLMLNARDDRLAEVLALLPGPRRPDRAAARPRRHARRARGRSTPTTSCACSARCARAGASSILVLPIEHLIP